MKFILLIVLSLISFNAWSFEYKIDQASLLNPSPTQIFSIGKIFTAQGFQSISDLNLTEAGFAFDRLYVSHEWGSSIVLKAGLKVPSNMLGKIIEDEKLGVKVIHFEYENTPYLVMGMNITKAEFREAVRPWVTSDASFRWSWLIPKAHAVSCMTQTKAPFKSTADSLERDLVLKTIGQCALDALGGAVGSVGSTLDFFKRLATEPRELWKETAQSVADLKNFVMNIDTELASAFESFQGLSSEEKIHMSCIVTGQVIGMSAQALLGGAAFAKLAPKMLLGIKKAIGLLKQVGSLTEKGIKFSNRSWLTRQAMSCAL